MIPYFNPLTILIPLPLASSGHETHRLDPTIAMGEDALDESRVIYSEAALNT